MNCLGLWVGVSWRIHETKRIFQQLSITHRGWNIHKQILKQSETLLFVNNNCGMNDTVELDKLFKIKKILQRVRRSLVMKLLFKLAYSYDRKKTSDTKEFPSIKNEWYNLPRLNGFRWFSAGFVLFRAVFKLIPAEVEAPSCSSAKMMSYINIG